MRLTHPPEFARAQTRQFHGHIHNALSSRHFRFPEQGTGLQGGRSNALPGSSG
jgi:hypothetical protein